MLALAHNLYDNKLYYAHNIMIVTYATKCNSMMSNSSPL